MAKKAVISKSETANNKTVELTKCKKVACGPLKFWYSEREDGVLELVAFQVLHKYLTFYIPRGSVISAVEDGDTLRIKVD